MSDLLDRAIEAYTKPPRKREETNLQARILKELARRGIFAWRNNTGVAPYVAGGARYGGGVATCQRVAYGYPGSADLLAVIPPRGKLLGIEVKSQTGRLNKTQQAFRDKLEGAGGWYFVADDFEIFTAWLDGVLVLGDK